MKIGFDAKRLYNNFTGLGNYSRSLVSDLQHYYPDNQYILFTPKVRRTPETLPFLENVNYKTIRPTLPIPSALWRSVGIKNDLKREKIDLYHGLSHELPVGIKSTKIKSIVTIHDLIFKHYPHFYNAIDRKIYDWKFHYACQHADAILTISESTKRDIIKFYKTPAEKIHVTYLTCHKQFYQQAEKSINHTSFLKLAKTYHLPDDYLLYVGAVNERKNLLSIIRAIQEIPFNNRLPLVVIGGGSAYKQKVEAYIRQHQLEQWVIFANIPFADFPTVYRNAKVLVYPSHYEGFGMPILEAQLCGTPVITTNVSSLPEVGGDAALYVAPNDVKAIAAAIEKIRTNNDLYDQLVERGYTHSKRFAPSVVTKEVMEVYQQVLNK